MLRLRYGGSLFKTQKGLKFKYAIYDDKIRDGWWAITKLGIYWIGKKVYAFDSWPECTEEHLKELSPSIYRTYIANKFVLEGKELQYADKNVNTP